jgi:hypothetical protein
MRRLSRWIAALSAVCTSAIVSVAAFAQTSTTPSGGGGTDVTSTTTTTNNWFVEPWVWAVGVGIAVFLVLVIALTNRGARST